MGLDLLSGAGGGALTVMFATCGYTSNPVVAPLRTRQDVDELHLFYGDGDQDQLDAALRAVRQVTSSFNVKLVEHRGQDAFNFDHFLRMFVKTYDAIPNGENVVFNVSGGPRPMIMAATIFCFTHDVPLVYYDEYNTKEGKEIPLKAYRSLKGLGKAKLAILQRLQKGPMDVSALAAKIHLAPSTMSVHLEELSKMGLVTKDRAGKRMVVHLLPEVGMLDLVEVTSTQTNPAEKFDSILDTEGRPSFTRWTPAKGGKAPRSATGRVFRIGEPAAVPDGWYEVLDKTCRPVPGYGVIVGGGVVCGAARPLPAGVAEGKAGRRPKRTEPRRAERVR